MNNELKIIREALEWVNLIADNILNNRGCSHIELRDAKIEVDKALAALDKLEQPTEVSELQGIIDVLCSMYPDFKETESYLRLQQLTNGDRE